MGHVPNALSDRTLTNTFEATGDEAISVAAVRKPGGVLATERAVQGPAQQGSVPWVTLKKVKYSNQRDG